eukprot:6190290-Heterocapsa_arctica.AAC.1
MAVDSALRLLDSRVEITPAWNDHGRIFSMPDGSAKFHWGARDLPARLDEMWPSDHTVGRYGLPVGFGVINNTAPPGAWRAAQNPIFMIYNERICDMPATLAARDENIFAKPSQLV